jgi:hypothetical protein
MLYVYFLSLFFFYSFRYTSYERIILYFEDSKHIFWTHVIIPPILVGLGSVCIRLSLLRCFVLFSSIDCNL